MRKKTVFFLESGEKNKPQGCVCHWMCWMGYFFEKWLVYNIDFMLSHTCMHIVHVFQCIFTLFVLSFSCRFYWLVVVLFRILAFTTFAIIQCFPIFVYHFSSNLLNLVNQTRYTRETKENRSGRKRRWITTTHNLTRVDTSEQR